MSRCTVSVDASARSSPQRSLRRVRSSSLETPKHEKRGAGRRCTPTRWPGPRATPGVVMTRSAGRRAWNISGCSPPTHSVTSRKTSGSQTSGTESDRQRGTRRAQVPPRRPHIAALSRARRAPAGSASTLRLRRGARVRKRARAADQTRQPPQPRPEARSGACRTGGIGLHTLRHTCASLLIAEACCAYNAGWATTPPPTPSTPTDTSSTESSVTHSSSARESARCQHRACGRQIKPTADSSSARAAAATPSHDQLDVSARRESRSACEDGAGGR
jgi:hypothetical protein